MKGSLKRLHVTDDRAPVDSVEVIDRNDLEDFRKEMWTMFRDHNEWDGHRFVEIENKIKTMGIVGGVVAAALCFVMIMRKDD